MIGDGLQCAVDFSNGQKRFYTNNDKIQGNLTLSAPHKNYVVFNIRGSLICEEWVHTTELEFKEHYRNNTRVFDVTKNPIELRPGHPARVPFELLVPANEDLLLPPSFDLKHNNVVWKVKFAIEYKSAPETARIESAQTEQRIRVCRYSAKLRPNLQDPTLTRHEWRAGKADFISTQKVLEKGESALGLVTNVFHPKVARKREDMDINLTLGVPTYGLVQSPFENGAQARLQLSVDAQSSGFILHEIALDLVKRVTTSGKDAYAELKPIIRTRQQRPLDTGLNDLTSYVEHVQLTGFTESFQTKWQQLAHGLRITLIFSFDGHSKPLTKVEWDVPVTVLSEAYGLAVDD